MQEILIYDNTWGMFLSIHNTSINNFEIRINNCQQDIMLFSIKAQTSPLLVVTISNSQGAVVPGQRKSVNCNISPTLDINSISVPYSIELVIASTSIQQIYRLYEVDMDIQSLISNFNGRKFDLNFPPRRAINSSEVFDIKDIQLLEDFNTQRHKQSTLNINLLQQLQKAYQILNSRYNYAIKHIINPSEAVKKSLIYFTQAILKFKVSLDYYNYINFTDRITLLNDFLAFLNTQHICPICASSEVNQNVFCGGCGCYLACCEKHAKLYANVHYADCKDLIEFQVLKILTKSELDHVVMGRNEKEEFRSSQGIGSSKQKEDWIIQAQELVDQTETYLNEICTFRVHQVQEYPEDKLKQIIKEGKLQKDAQKDNIEHEVNQMMETIEKIQDEKIKFKKFLHEKYGTKKIFQRNIKIEQDNSGNEPIKRLEPEIEQIVDEMDKDAPINIYQQVIQRVLKEYGGQFQLMKDQNRTLKKYIYVYEQECSQLYQELKSEYQQSLKAASSYGDPNILRIQVVSDNDQSLELLALVKKLDVFMENKSSVDEISVQQDVIGQKLINMEILTQQSNIKYQQLDLVLKSKRVNHSKSSGKFQAEQQKLQKIVDYNAQLQEMLKCVESSIFDQDGYYRMIQQGTIDFSILKQPKVNSRSNSKLRKSNSNSSFTSSIGNESGYEDCLDNIQQNNNSKTYVNEVYLNDFDNIQNRPTTIQDISQGLLINSPVQPHKNLSVNINLNDTHANGRVNLTIYESLENMTRSLVQYAEKFNQINSYDQQAYFKLQDISTQCYSRIYVNMARVMQKKLLDFDQQEVFDFKDVITVKRRLYTLDVSHQFKEYIKQWISIQEEYEKLQNAIERQIWYCIAYSPEVLNTYPRRSLQVPIINFGLLDKQQLALQIDGVQDL
ncbi:hypothetical protein SS50377_27683 [Spironucleus salmonicida]|uniref:Uncharacterized protein n=1 Tax=Spironucleus salmonicida TaxID=348837 RepID=V6LS71_9EUKA|nr:hypothetical protein SS50377_27683 [Spironucleus salmonicida]|eukprot:EST46541.1 hypothetical protein SS50377_13346 [Spironucleus salmonicida]